MSLWYFLNKNFGYGPFTCDGCYDTVQRSTDFKDIGIVHIKNNAYRIYFQHMSKHEAKKIVNKLVNWEIFIVTIKNDNYNHNHKKK